VSNNWSPYRSTWAPIVKIIVALDNLKFDKAFEMVVQLSSYVDGWKINHTLLDHSQMFSNYEGELFIDLKLWDTPNSVCSAIEMVLEKGATMTTISTFNNSEVFRNLHQYSEDIKLLGVTYLTSWNETEQYSITREPKHNMWNRHIKRIKKYGFRGIICSSADIEDIDKIDTDLLRLCPGITFRSSNSGQARTTTPRQAQELGTDFAIIGRSITKANNPVETIEAIRKSLIHYKQLSLL
jgi:orotidine-5'-phosphate decarboxylase